MNEINWEKMQGLVPAIVQDANTGAVLMLAYMNKEALEKTKASGWVTFYSRSKQALWVKGETSGNKLKLVKILPDCDQDTLLILAEPMGPACHNGTTTCFGDDYQNTWSFLSELEKVIAARKTAKPDQSYTAKLFDAGVKRIAQKVGEEGVETALAAVTHNNEELCNEAADLLFHLLVLLQVQGLNLGDVIKVLQKRNN